MPALASFSFRESVPGEGSMTSEGKVIGGFMFRLVTSSSPIAGLNAYLICSRPSFDSWSCTTLGTISFAASPNISGPFVASFNDMAMKNKRFPHIFHCMYKEVRENLAAGDTLDLDVYVEIHDASPSLDFSIVHEHHQIRAEVKKTVQKLSNGDSQRDANANHLHPTSPPSHTHVDLKQPNRFNVTILDDKQSLLLTCERRGERTIYTSHWTAHVSYKLVIQTVYDGRQEIQSEGWFSNWCPSLTHKLEKGMVIKTVSLHIISENHYPSYIGSSFIPPDDVPLSVHAEFFNNAAQSDVRINAGPNSEHVIYGHRFVLSMISRNFEKPLAALKYTGSVKKPAIINAKGKDREVFLSFLRFGYCRQLVLPDATTSLDKLLELAKSLEVVDIIKACCSLMRGENVLLFLPYQSILPENFVATLWITVDTHAHAVLSSNYFVHLNECDLIRVIKRDTFYAPEYTIFHAVLSWADHECRRRNLPIDDKHRRQVLCPEGVHQSNSILRYIRFPTMSKIEFTEDDYIRNILDDRDKNFVLRAMDRTNREPVGLERFNCHPRRKP